MQVVELKEKKTTNSNNTHYQTLPADPDAYKKYTEDFALPTPSSTGIEANAETI